MEERRDQVLQTLNFHIRLSPLKWCPTTGIIHTAKFKYASLQFWWRSCRLIEYSTSTILVNENELFMSTSDATEIQTFTYNQKHFHCNYIDTKERQRDRKKGTVNREVVQQELGWGVSFQFVFCFGVFRSLLLCWSGSPHQDLSRALISSSKMKTCFPFQRTDPGY